MGAQVWPVLAGLLLIVGSTIHLTDAGACKPAACGSAGGNKLFSYQPGHTYTYKVEGTTMTNMPEQQEEAVKMQFQAVAEVNFGASCTNTLQLKSVKVIGPNAKVYGKLGELEKYPVRFSFHDGQLDPEICADADDSNTALNIKRAVISLLQVATPTATGTSTKTEVDIFGACPTTFEVSTSGTDATITKSRNLNKCLYREAMRNHFTSANYAANSELQGSPLLDANLVVEMKVQGGVAHSASSHEVYLYRPFANRDAGSKTVVHTTITFQTKTAQPPHPCKANAAKSIIFDAPHGSITDKSSVAAITAAMQTCKESMPDSVHPTAAAEFRHLVEVFRSSKKDDLLAVFGQVKGDKASGRKLFFDALFRAGTGDSVQVAVELLKAKEINESWAKLWFMSFGFVRHATPGSLSAAASLLDDPNAPSEAFLGVGALGHRYCGEHACQGNKDYANLMTKLSKPLLGGCKCSSYEQENKIIAALKGIENMKGMSEATAELIRVCMSDPTVPARVRVAALETARSDACQPQIKKTTMELMANTQEDSEIRIKAYLAAVECPCGKCANNLKAMLDVEPVNQVGAFIVSHLRNIRASANPEKALQKQHLSEIRTTKKFPFDFRKFSQNYEVSHLLDALNVGSSLEANVIYSQQSYLPRSTSLNLTTEIFGHSVNLLEISTRAENLERLMEKWLGPRGYFKTHSVDEMIESVKPHYHHLEEKVKSRLEKTLRGKRSVSVNALEKFRKAVHMDNSDRDIYFDVNMKMFGSTVCHQSHHGDGHDFSIDNFIDKVFDRVDSGIEKAKNFNYDLKHHTLFYENEFSYPTGLGFPIKMTLVGSAAAHMKLGGKVDLHALRKDPRNAHFQIESAPSAAVDITGTMEVDAYAVQAGLKVLAELHTSTSFNVDVKNLEGHGVDVTFGVPARKQELVNFKTDVLTTVRERGLAAQDTHLTFNTKRKDFKGCFDQLSKAVGVTLCGDFSFPYDGASTKAAFFPFNGHSRANVHLLMEDVHAYRFKTQFHLFEGDRRFVEFLVDTPNSQANRKIEVLLEAVRSPNYEVRAKISSPFKSVLAELIYVNTNKENSLTGRVLEDNKEYFAKLAAEVSGSFEHQTYKPSFEYRMPGGQSEKLVKGKGKGKPAKQQKSTDYAVEGTITVDRADGSRKYTFNDVILTIPIGKVTVNGNAGYDPNCVYTDLSILKDKDTILVKGRADKVGPMSYKVTGEFQISNYPDLGVNLDMTLSKENDEMDMKVVVIHGADLTSDQARITYHGHLKSVLKEKLQDFYYKRTDTLTYPLLGVDCKEEVELTPSSAIFDIGGSYDKYSVSTKGHFKTGVKVAGDYDVELEAKVLDNHFMFETKRDIVSPHDNKFSTVLDMKPGGRYELTADTTCKMETTHTLHKLLAVLKMEGQPEPHTLDMGMELSPALFESHFKVGRGSEDFVHFLAKLVKGSNPNGNFKAFVKGHVDGSGDFSYEAGKGGSLKALVSLVKLQKTMKAQGTCTCTGTRTVSNLEVLFDAADPSKKIVYEGDCDTKPESVDSKHSLTVFGHKTSVNYKGSMTGTYRDGTVKGHADVTLPTHHHFTGSLSRELHATGPDASGAWHLELAAADKKGAPARSLIVDAKANNCNRQHLYYDVDLSLTYKNLQGKDVKYHVASKHLPDGDNKHVEFLGQIEGSLLDMAPMVHLKADIVKPVTTFYAKVNLAADSNVEMSGSYQDGSDGSVPFQFDCVTNINLPTGELKNIKVTEHYFYIPGKKETPCELKGSVVTTYNSANTAKLDFEMKGNPEAGQGKVSLSLPKDELRVVKATYHNGKGPDMEREGSVTLIHGQDETHLELKVKIPQDKNSLHLTMNGRTPTQTTAMGLSFKTFGIVFNSARGETITEADATIELDGKKTVVTTKYSRDWKNPMFEIEALHPEGKTCLSFYVKQKGAGTEHYEGEVKYQHIEDVGYVKFDVLAPSLQDFTVTVDADSPRLKVNQIHLVVSNKPGVKGGKTLSVLQTEAGQTTINGKLDFTSSEGADGVIFEVKGNVQVHGENRPCKIIYRKNIITSPVENGFEYVMEGSLGQKTFGTIYKQTTKEVHLKANECVTAGSCSNIEYLAKVTTDGLDFTNEVLMEVDLTAHGYPTDMSFSRITYRKGAEFLHKVQFNNKKAQIVMFKFGFDDKASSLCLLTPSREMAVESTYSLAVEGKGKESIKYQYVAHAWLDKGREPDTKATLSLNANYQRVGDTVTLGGESRFAHPALAQDMVVKGTSTLSGRKGMTALVDVDVFAKKAQKITIEGKYSENEIAHGYNYTSVWSIKSKGQKLDIVSEDHLVLSWSVIGAGSMITYTDDKGKRDVGFGIEFTKNRNTFFVKSPKDMLVDFTVLFDVKNDMPCAEAYVSALGCQGLVGKAYFEPGYKFIYFGHKKNTPENQLIGEVSYDLTQKVQSILEWVHGGDRKVLYDVGFKVDEKVTPDCTVNFDNMKALLVYLKEDVKGFVEQGRVVSKGIEDEVKTEVSDIAEALKKSQLNLRPLVAAYQKQLQALRAEIASEPAVQEMSGVVKKLASTMTEVFGQVTEMVAKVADKLLDIFEEFSSTVLGSLKRFMPQATASCNKIYNAGLDIFNAVATQALNRLQDIIELCKKHEPELKQIGGAIAEMTRDVVQTVGKGCSHVVKEIKDFMVIIVDQIKALPVFTMLQEKLDEMKVQVQTYVPTDQALAYLHDVTKAVKDTMPTPELRDFVECVSAYLEKLLKKAKMDNAAEGKKIYQKGVAAYKSVIALARAEIAGKDGAAPDIVGTASPFSIKSLYKIPLAAAVHFSPLELLRSDDLPTIGDFLLTYLPRSLNPLDMFAPFKAYGVVVDTSNFITFDKRMFAFKGACSYILVQDVTDGNFTVVLNLEKNGKLKSYALSDGKDTAEYSAQGVLTVNGKTSEFPAHTENLKVWRRYHTVVLQSNAGVRVKIHTDYSVTVVGLSGFYHGRVRGLLGDSNYEPYDDFRLPNGQICADTADLANSYQVGGGCAPSVALDTKVKPEAVCTDFFSSTSPFRHAFPLFNPDVYREVCNTYVSSTSNKKQEYACRIAAAYVLYVRKSGMPIELPSSCASCKSTTGSFKVGETVGAKVPTDKADVVLMVEQVAANAEVYKELVSPLVEALTADLKAKKISDVAFSLVGFGHPKEEGPEHHTSNGKLGFDGKATLEFGDAKKTSWGKTCEEKLAHFVHKLRVETGLTSLFRAVADVLHYPWRVGASKAVVLVMGRSCEKGLILRTLRELVLSKMARTWGISVHVVSPMEGFNIVGNKDAKTQSSIVGFDSETVYSFADGKKKTMEGAGNADLRSEIEFNQDSCIETALASNGAAYNARNFLEAKGNQRKQFLQVLVNKLSQSLTTELSEECSCSLYRGLYPEPNCRVVGGSAALKSQTETVTKSKKGGKKPKH